MSTTLYTTRLANDRTTRTLNVWLWIAQVLLALFFLAAGSMHAFMPIERAATIAPWIASAPVALVRFIGIVELAGAIGVVLPAATRIMPWLTPLAAVGLATTMILAMPVHIARGEMGMINRNIAALAVAGFVAWGRTFRVPIRPRSSKR